jgi:L-2-amino-thiazoline-4-carboxylic acid hydrolase
MDIEYIPAEIRWKIATKASTMATVAQSHALQDVVNDEVADQMLSMMMGETGKQAGELAATLGLPAGNAIETSEAWGIVGTILLGPEIESQVVEADENRVVDRITGCAMLNAHQELGLPFFELPGHCQAYNSNTVEAINPKYTQHFTKRMCAGDKYCESYVELKK